MHIKSHENSLIHDPQQVLNTATPTKMSLDIIDDLLNSNRKWVTEINISHPGFFFNSSKGQHPEVLWFGCSDSRVPESVITAQLPGEIFTHRNIANQFPVDDTSAMAVLEFSVENLYKVDGTTPSIGHIIVAGHTQCGGAKAALQAARSGKPPPTDTPLQRWLVPLIQRVIDMDIDPDLPEDKAVELVIDENIKMQVENISETDVIAKAKSDGRVIYIHSWLYHLENGFIEAIRPPLNIKDI